MRNAVSAGDWAEAMEQTEAVLIENPDSPSVLSEVAKVAFANDRQDLAADLMLAAVEADDYEDPGLVKLAATGLISRGRITETIQIIDRLVAKSPEHHELRRWLFDFQRTMEERGASIKHGRALVMSRRFDFALLLELGNTEERKLENDSNDQMVKRNPADTRPRIAAARVYFDRGKLKQSQTALAEILDKHPDHLPSHLLLGRVHIDAGQFDRLLEWSRALPDECRDNWEYWMVLGDASRKAGDFEGSVAAYWKSTQCNPDVVQVWSKLASGLLQLQEMGRGDYAVPLRACRERATLLSRLHDQKERFERSNRESIPVIIEIVQSLIDLGRPWEAEAWAAKGLTIPSHSASNLEAKNALNDLRNSLTSDMQQTTPWQTLDNHRELQLDFHHLDLPVFDHESVARESVPNLPTIRSAAPVLRNRSQDLGLTFFGRTRDDLNQPGALIYAELGCGGGAIDVDLDGWPDLCMADAGGRPPNHDSRPNRLFRNQNGQFLDVTASSGLADTGFSQGIAVGDLNSDGFPDVLVLNYGPNRLLINNGDGSFSDRSNLLPDQPADGWSTSGAIGDIDHDGLPDAVILNYCKGLTPVTKVCEDGTRDISRSCAPLAFEAMPDLFVRSTNTGEFSSVNEKWGVNPSLTGRGLGVVIGSLDCKPGCDVFVANDMTNNHFFSQAPGSNFRLDESAVVRGIAYDNRSSPQASMGIATADLDRDQDIDLLVTNFENEYHTFHQQVEGNVWRDVTVENGIATPTLPSVGFGTEAVDFDNDGQYEIYVANGHVDFPIEEGDADYEQFTQIFVRRSTGGYDLSPRPDTGYLSRPHVARAMWTIDANRDGRMDAMVTHQTEPAALLINETRSENHWIRLHLSGQKCGRDAIGAIVRLSDGSQNWMAAMLAGDGFLCSNERVIHIGLGQNRPVVSISIEWPDGTTQHHTQMETQQEWLVVQGLEPFVLSPR